MARKCALTNKGGGTGNTRSKSLRATRRKFNVNLVSVKINGRRMRVAASTLRSLTKQLPA